MAVYSDIFKLTTPTKTVDITNAIVDFQPGDAKRAITGEVYGREFHGGVDETKNGRDGTCKVKMSSEFYSDYCVPSNKLSPMDAGYRLRNYKITQITFNDNGTTTEYNYVIVEFVCNEPKYSAKGGEDNAMVDCKMMTIREF